MLTDADKKFCASIGQHVRQSLLAWWAEGCGTTSEHESRAGEVLTPEAQADRDDFDLNYASMGCQCCISPPCNYCVHPGNPENQEENDGCWVPAIAVWRVLRRLGTAGKDAE